MKEKIQKNVKGLFISMIDQSHYIRLGKFVTYGNKYVVGLQVEIDL